MKTLSIILFSVLLTVSLVNGQDTTRVPVKQDDPAMQQSPRAIQENMLKDMVKITATQLPEGVKKAIESDAFKGSKTYYKHKEKDEYAVEVRDGEVSSFHFYSKDGKALNKQD